MKGFAVAKAKFSWNDVSKDEMTKLLSVIGGDGHTIYNESYLLEHDVPNSVVNAFVTTYKSDGTLKGNIEVNGAPVKSMKGVYGLSVLWSLASHFNVESDKMGRGFQARELTDGIRKALAE